MLNIKVVKVQQSRDYQHIKSVNGETLLFKPSEQVRTVITFEVEGVQGTVSVNSEEWNRFMSIAALSNVPPDIQKVGDEGCKPASSEPVL